MTTKYEDAPNEQYLIWSQNVKKIVSYKRNVIEEIQQHVDPNEYPKIATFSAESVTEKRFQEFIPLAEKAGFAIYKVIRQ